ncbi:MAG: hypothetical protein ABJ308_13660 [Halieaceae bacterium]
MKSRNKRTVFLGLLATVTFVWAAIDRFDVPAEEMAWLMLYCVLGVLLTMLLAALSVGLLVLGKKLFARISGREQNPDWPPE